MRTDFGAAIRQRRTAKKWTQGDLSRVTGIGRSQLSGMENSREPPSPKMVARLGLAFGDVFGLFDLTDYGRQRAIIALEELEDERAEQPQDIEQVISTALRAGGWHGDVVKALLVLVEATRPGAATRELRAIAEPRAAYEC